MSGENYSRSKFVREFVANWNKSRASSQHPACKSADCQHNLHSFSICMPFIYFPISLISNELIAYKLLYFRNCNIVDYTLLKEISSA